MFRHFATFLCIPIAFLGRAILPGRRIREGSDTRLILPENRPPHLVTLGFWVGACASAVLVGMDGPMDALWQLFQDAVLPKT